MTFLDIIVELMWMLLLTFGIIEFSVMITFIIIGNFKKVRLEQYDFIDSKLNSLSNKIITMNSVKCKIIIHLPMSRIIRYYLVTADDVKIPIFVFTWNHKIIKKYFKEYIDTKTIIDNKALEDDKWFQNKQESLYAGHQNLCWKSWYRKLYGGKWRLIKCGKDTPAIRLFSFWTKIPDSGLSGYYEVYDECNYPLTGVNTKKKLYKQFFKFRK